MASNQSKQGSKQVSRLQQWLENIWYNNGSGKFLLMPLSALYCAINYFQRVTKTNSTLKLPCPIIVVGNITVGGTGKTPLTIHIVKILQKAGYKPGIITRGYGGQATVWPQSVTPNSDPQQVGDEAVLMANQTQVPVYAGADRLESIEALTKVHDCDVIVSDDGMQHYKLPRDIQIAVLDGARMLGNGWCLPAGPLRERKQRLDYCDLLVVNGDITNNSAKNRKNNLLEKQIYTMSLKGTMLTNLVTKEQITVDQLNSKSVHAVTGIGNPQRFFQTLENNGGLELNTHSFPDHYDFIEADLHFNDDLPIVMTEKDAVKCRKFAKKQFWVLPVIAKLDEGFESALLKLLSRL